MTEDQSLNLQLYRSMRSIRSFEEKVQPCRILLFKPRPGSRP